MNRQHAFLDAIRDLPPYVFVMIGLYAGLRREEILALQWDSVYLDTDTPYLTVRAGMAHRTQQTGNLRRIENQGCGEKYPSSCLLG